MQRHKGSSVTSTSTIQTEEPPVQHVIAAEPPFHKMRDSLLSSASGYTNYRGILNLCIVLLVMSTGRLVLENLLKYGFLVRFDAPLMFIKDPTAWPSVLVLVCANLFIYNALRLERKMLSGEIEEKKGLYQAVGNVFMTLILPAIYLWYRETNPLSSFIALSTYSCLSMKLFSYLHVNKTERQTYRKLQEQKHDTKSKKNDAHHKENGDAKIKSNGSVKPTTDDEIVKYPDNLTVKNLYYFIAAPTLCYELNYPRSPRIRIRFVFRRIAEIAFLLMLQLILLQQWIVPIVQNSKMPFRETNILKLVERLLKLAVPNHVIWLIFFYCLFHSYLNLIGELLRFGDREFYRDWWNAETVSDFWKKWNVPVHSFCSRHIYKPLLRTGLNKLQAAMIVFFVSAFFHEYLVSIPLRMFRLWAFFGMVLQIPFAAFVNKFLHGNYGNMAVWVSLIIGQPVAIMMYIHDYYFDYFRLSSD